MVPLAKAVSELRILINDACKTGENLWQRGLPARAESLAPPAIQF